MFLLRLNELISQTHTEQDVSAEHSRGLLMLIKNKVINLRHLCTYHYTSLHWWGRHSNQACSSGSASLPSGFHSVRIRCRSHTCCDRYIGMLEENIHRNIRKPVYNTHHLHFTISGFNAINTCKGYHFICAERRIERCF